MKTALATIGVPGEVPERVSEIKNRILPSAVAIRRLPWGIGRGVRLKIDFAEQTKLYFGLYEIEINRYIREFCVPGAACFDVGGQHGYDALVLARLTGGRVRSFDCDPTACTMMRRAFDVNPAFAGQLDALRVRVAERSDRELGRLSLDDAAYGVDGFVPDVVKIDIDGGEVEALTGARRLLAERRPHMIIETHSPELEHDCGEILCRAGYRPAIVNQRGWLRDLRTFPHNRWLIGRGADPAR